MKKLLLSSTLFFLSFSLFAQVNTTPLTCGHTEYMNRLKQASGYNPVCEAMDAAYEQEIQDIIANQTPEQRDNRVVYVIPIVFHVIHEGGIENISDAQILDALRILNDDYNKLNADTASVVASFANNIANVGFEFRLAKKDALGNCVSGITRTYSSTTNDGDNSTVDAVIKNINTQIGQPGNTSSIRFPRSKYLNIWICKDLGSAAGYTNTPNNWGQAKYDGIWVSYSYVGSIGTSSPNSSRTLTHEVGHWFNLSHVWGNTNNPEVDCSGTDNVSDTPTTQGHSPGHCYLNDQVCTPGTVENVQNYMEYAYCSRMFTNGQKARMVAAITSSTAQRNQLWLATNLTNAGVDGAPSQICTADFSKSKYTICAGDSLDFFDASFNDPTSWSWTFAGGSPSASTDQNPVNILYSTPGLYSVTLTATNASGSQTDTKTSYVVVLPAVGTIVAPFSEGFESVTSIPDNNWFVNNFDGTQAFQVVSGVAATGNKSIKLTNYSQSGGLDEIISSTYDLSGMSAVTFSFKYAFAYKNSSNGDYLRMYVSTDCGESWSMRKALSGTNLNTANNTTAAFTPTAAQWVQVDVTNIISTYLVDNFMFKFEFRGDGGNNLYIDDINLTGAVGINESENALQFEIYPNPIENDATLVFGTTTNETVSVEVLDVLGKVVFTQSYGTMAAGNHNLKLSRSGLSDGVYFVRLNIGNQSVTRKVILN